MRMPLLLLSNGVPGRFAGRQSFNYYFLWADITHGAIT
jgi:hypothetical protein